MSGCCVLVQLVSKSISLDFEHSCSQIKFKMTAYGSTSEQDQDCEQVEMSISICVCLLEYALHEFTILSVEFLNSSTIGKLNSIVNFAPNREKALKQVNFIVSTSQLQKRCLYKFLKKPVKERQKRTERNCWENIEVRGHPLLFIVISVSDYAYTIF